MWLFVFDGGRLFCSFFKMGLVDRVANWSGSLILLCCDVEFIL